MFIMFHGIFPGTIHLFALALNTTNAVNHARCAGYMTALGESPGIMVAVILVTFTLAGLWFISHDIMGHLKNEQVYIMVASLPR